MKREFYDFSEVHFVGRKRLAFKKRLLPVIIVFFIVATLLASAAIFLFAPKSVNIPLRRYYFVVASNHTSMDAAMVRSEEIRSVGGSGYVLSDDDLYRVVVFVYLSYVDANAVAQKMQEQGGEAYVYQKTLSSVKIKVKTAKHRRRIKSAFSFCEDVINGLYETIISLEKSEVTISVAKKQIEKYYTEAAAVFSKLNKVNSEYGEGSTVAKFTEVFKKIIGIIENSVADPSELKYVLCQVVDLFTIFTN